MVCANREHTAFGESCSVGQRARCGGNTPEVPDVNLRAVGMLQIGRMRKSRLDGSCRVCVCVCMCARTCISILCNLLQ